LARYETADADELDNQLMRDVLGAIFFHIIHDRSFFEDGVDSFLKRCPCSFVIVYSELRINDVDDAERTVPWINASVSE